VRRARSFIYLEQQYLSSKKIFRELKHALETNQDLEVIIVANQNADITAYSRWQTDALSAFGMLDHPRVGIFALWSASSGDSAREINQVFVHSKVIVIDDRWAMCGSANLDGVSLYSYGADFSGWLGRRIFRNVRNFDVAVSVDGFDEVGDQESATTLRRELWSEHLGLEFDPQTVRPFGGWLPVWRSAAATNVATLNSGSVPGEGSFILPYSISDKPSAQLQDCDVNWKGESEVLRFNPGWFERSFGLGWVRNMFA
jgi:hypothetical protein